MLPLFHLLNLIFLCSLFGLFSNYFTAFSQHRCFALYFINIFFIIFSNHTLVHSFPLCLPIFFPHHIFSYVSARLSCRKGGKWFWCKQNTPCKPCNAQHIINYMFLMFMSSCPFLLQIFYVSFYVIYLIQGSFPINSAWHLVSHKATFFLNTYITLNTDWEASSTYNFHLLICYNLTIKPKQVKI